MALHLNTVSDFLWEALNTLMMIEEFNPFRLVGGTSLSLLLGHRESVDIDLFTDADYGSVDFERLNKILMETFTKVETDKIEVLGMGKPYFITNNKGDQIKLDLFYTDSFVYPCHVEHSIRLASIEEIAAMKLDVISRGGRKKDFWDLHELLEKFNLDNLFNFYLKRYPYGVSKEVLLKKIVDFSVAEDDFTPNCFKDKDWAIIKLDLEDLVKY